AVAYDQQQTGSDPVEIVLRHTGAKPLAGRLLVLSVGVSQYQHADGQGFRNLQFPAADAQAIAERFAKEGPPLYARVQTYPLLTNQKATLANIRAGLKWLQEQARPGQVDTVVIFLSGHGISDARGRYFFAPYDFDVKDVDHTGLSGLELQQALGG